MRWTIETDIGIVPNDATIVSLEDCLSVIIDHRGKTPKKLDSNWVKKGIPAISAKNVHKGRLDNLSSIRYVTQEVYEKWMKDDIVKGDCFLVSEGATLGEVLYWDFDYPIVLSQRLFCIRTNPDVLYSKYFYAYMNTFNFQRQVEARATGSSVDGLRQTEVLKLQVPIIPIERQKFIGDLLYNLERKQKDLEEQNKTLETMAQTIFKEWFGKYQIGDELPEGWRLAKVSEFVRSSIGGDYGKETIEGDYTEETICLRGTDLPDMKMGTPKKAPIRFLKASKLERCKLENGDIVVEISGGTENQSTGRAMYINEKILSSAKHPMTCVNFCRIIRPLKIEYSYFLHSLFDYLYTRKVFFNWENGTTGIKNLNLNALLEDFDLFIPKNEDSILDFNNNVQAVFNKIQTNNSQVQSLTKTRDTLLPKLMSGQVRVNNIKQTANA